MEHDDQVAATKALKERKEKERAEKEEEKKAKRAKKKTTTKKKPNTGKQKPKRKAKEKERSGGTTKIVIRIKNTKQVLTVPEDSFLEKDKWLLGLSEECKYVCPHCHLGLLAEEVYLEEEGHFCNKCNFPVLLKVRAIKDAMKQRAQVEEEERKQKEQEQEKQHGKEKDSVQEKGTEKEKEKAVQRKRNG